MENCTNGICETTAEETDQPAKVSLKERYTSLPICYCFHIFRQDIEQEIKKTGKTVIPDFLRAQIKVGNCRCEATNPKKTCCLGNVSAVVKTILKKEKPL